MHIFADAFSYAKTGNRPDENEDSCWPLKVDESVSSFTGAVSDGATTSIFAGAWSKLLVEHFGKAGFSENNEAFRKEIRYLQEQWLKTATEKPLPWYAEHKVQRGAFASLIALRVFECDEAPHLRWRAAAIGDSCLFHLRGNKLLLAFPLDRSEKFDANPHLICSNEGGNQEIEQTIIPVEGKGQIDDAFLLTTDMVARCLCKMCEQDESPWEYLLGVDSQESFQEWIESHRIRLGIRHDDATMLRVQIS